MSLLPASSIGDESTGFYNGVATQSLRMNINDSNYLYYTPSTGDRFTGTYSTWYKGSQLNDSSYGAYYFNAYGGGSEVNFTFAHIANDFQLAFDAYGANYFHSNALYRDETNWYNIVWVWDTPNGTQTKRQRGFVNGVEVTDMSIDSRSSHRQMLAFGGNHQHTLFANYYNGNYDSYASGHHSYNVYVNGHALDPTAFGELKNGVWIPKEYATKPSLIAQDTGTAIGDLTGQSGLAGAFDGNRFESYSNAAASGSQATGYIGKNWGSSKTVTGFILYSPTQYGFVGSGASTFTVKLYGSNSNPSNSTDGTLLYTSSSVNDNLISTNGERGSLRYFADTTIISEETVSNFTTGTAYSYHWVTITPNTSESIHVSEIEFYEDGNNYFGTGGFRLDFNASDLNTSGSSRTDPYGSDTDQPNNTIADTSGSGNHLYKSTNVASTDFVKDSPENNFCILNAVGKQSASALSEGNLKTVITSGTNSGRTPGTFAVNSGKWYWEVRQSSSNRFGMGVFDTEKYIMANEDGGVDQYEWALVTDDNSGAAQLVHNSNYTNGYGGTAADGHVVMVALDVDNGAIWFGKQGTWFNTDGSSDSDTVKGQIEGGTTTNAAFTSVTGRLTPMFVRQTSNNTIQVNFGQDATFAGTESSATKTDENGIGAFQYDVPSGFLALCSSNLPKLALSPAKSEQADHYFDATTYTATGGSSDSAGQAPARDIGGFNFQPDWVIIKGRSYTDWGAHFDSARGAGKTLQAFRDYTEGDYANTLTSFNSDGFSLGADSTAQVNWRQNNYVAHAWKAGGPPTASNSESAGATPTAGSVKIDGSNLGSALAGSIAATEITASTTSGFSVVLYTGTGSAATVAHGLSSAPEFILVMGRNVSNSTMVGITAYNGWTHYIALSNSGYSVSDSTIWNNTAPTSSVFSVGTAANTNQSSKTYVAFCMHSVEGFSKFGTYVGNNSTDGTFVYTGFKPAFVLVKLVSAGGEDFIYWDRLRDPDNLVHNKLYWNANNSEITDTTNRMMDWLSDGFVHRTDHVSTNGNGGIYMYMAFAEQPVKFSTAR